MAYAVIAVGGKQYVVHEGEHLLVDRLAQDEGAVFQPVVLLVDAGTPDLKPSAGAVSARILKHTLGEKIRIAKYKPKKGYRRHTGFRAQLSQIQIESIGTGKAARADKSETVAEAPVAAKPKAVKPAAVEPEVEPKAPAKTPAKPAAKPAAKAVAAKPAAAKPAAKKPAATKRPAAKAPAKAKVETAKKPAAKKPAPRKKAES
ncbi:MAG TPA: 50S ribosomal protein L21 [Gaiellaceae bacterium]